MRKKILERIETQGDLPPFPDILLKLQTVLDDPDAGMSDVARIIELDPALSGKILNLSNSAFYHTGYIEIDTLSMAVNKLGLEKIRQLAFSLEMTKLFLDVKLVRPRQFWAHCLSVANFTQMLSQYSDVSSKIRNIAYLAGLMHDIGIMVMVYLIPKTYARFLKGLEKASIPLEKQEFNAFGIDHQEAGARYIEKWWHLDDQIVTAVRNHHLPFIGSANEQKCQQLVHLADGICNSYGQSNGIACYSEVFNPGAWEALGLSLDDVEKMMADIHVSVNQAMELLG